MATSSIDAKKLVDHLGGITTVATELANAGVAVSRKAVASWTERGSIPSKYLLTLVEIGHRLEKPVVLINFKKQ